MHRVVYKVPENLTKGPCGNTEQREMVTVAMEIHKESRQKIKVCYYNLYWSEEWGLDNKFHRAIKISSGFIRLSILLLFSSG